MTGPALPEPPAGESENYRGGWADGCAGKGADINRLNDGASWLNDYERGYIDSGAAMRAAGLET